MKAALHAQGSGPAVKAARVGTWWASSLAFHGVVLLLVLPLLLSARFVPDEPTDMIVRHSRAPRGVRPTWPRTGSTQEPPIQVQTDDDYPDDPDS